MKLDRLISMIYMLLNNEVISASELAEKYGVSQRTIYRDIDVICAAGIPVVSYQGVNGGYGIIDTYKMDKSLLGSYDAGSLITVLHSMSTVFDDERAMETVRKLQTIQKDDHPPNLSMDIGSVQVYNESLRALRSAIMDRHVIQFEYVNGRNERVTRRVEPVSLHFQYNAWYLYGYCRERNDYREFKISRMAHLLALPEQYQRVHQSTPQRMSYENYRWTDHVDVILHFSKESLARALDYFYDAEKSFNPDGSLTVKLKLDNDVREKKLLSILLSFGDEAEVVEPAHLRRELKEMLEKMLKKYAEA
ncbi:helix-turn-helix transcriptional regulator [Paenibacillus harenae]|uniref:helix-turn-helix transcriptional regulator n=1 Tax=Paenibacillus harenae TaxID=306543 RepID=UPI00040C77E5|nr:YafY family protein [Paenibacillus harenae]